MSTRPLPRLVTPSEPAARPATDPALPCFVCEGTGFLRFPLGRSRTVTRCWDCGGRATAGVYLVRLVRLLTVPGDVGPRVVHQELTTHTASFPRAVAAARRAYRLMARLSPATFRGVRVVFRGPGVPNGRVRVFAQSHAPSTPRAA